MSLDSNVYHADLPDALPNDTESNNTEQFFGTYDESDNSGELMKSNIYLLLTKELSMTPQFYQL